MISQRMRTCNPYVPIIALLPLMLSPSVSGVTVTVQEPNGAPVAGFRWLLERDTTNHAIPGVPVADIIGEGWVGLNDPLAQAGLYAAPCNEDGTFVIHNVPAGTYQFVTWDTPLLNLFGIHTVTVGEGEYVDLGDVLEFRWFGTLEGSVFFDNGGGDPTKANNGFRDPGEVGIPEQAINLRFRDGTVYQVQPTDLDGEYAFDAVFPFFKWLVVEVDFLRFKDTGMTAVVDGDGP